MNVTDKLSDPSIESKIEVITYFLDRTKKQKSNEQFVDLISDYLFEKVKISLSESYNLIGPKYALGCFLGHFLFYYLSEKDYTKQIDLLTNLLSYISGFQQSQAPLLKKTSVVKMINTIARFGLPSSFLRVSNGSPLLIYFIPFEHKEVNAAYYPYINSITSYKPKENLSPEYIFVHEVGHLLIYNITGDPEKVPDSFIAFNEKFNPRWNGDLVEVFVDLFSIAVMMDTEYASKNPFLTKFSLKDHKTIKNYFVKLIKSGSKCG